MTAHAASSSRGSVLVIQHDDDAPPAVLTDAAASSGLALDVRNVAAGDEIPAAVERYEGVVLLGGDASLVTDRGTTTAKAECGVIERAVEARVPTLGLCLGAQLCALALGGDVQRGDQGPEIGWVECRPTEAGGGDPIGAALGRAARVLEWHEDVCIEPPGATRIVTADRYPVQGFRLESVWALQFHPEVDEATLAAWCRSRKAREQLDELRVSPSELVAGVEPNRGPSRRVLDAWCELVARGDLIGSDTPPPGAAPDRLEREPRETDPARGRC